MDALDCNADGFVLAGCVRNGSRRFMPLNRKQNCWDIYGMYVQLFDDEQIGSVHETCHTRVCAGCQEM